MPGTTHATPTTSNLQQAETAEEAVARVTAIAASEKAKAKPVLLPDESPKERVRRLSYEIEDLRNQLTESTARACSGKAVNGDELAALTSAIAVRSAALSEAQRDCAAAAKKEEQELQESRKLEFERRCSQAREARDKFQQAWRSAAVELGNYCESTRAAIWLDGALRGSSVVPDFPRRDQITDIANRAKLSPQNAMLSEGFTVTMDYGFDLQVPVVPLFAKEK
jgi:DNA repair exonuclease SbcCD ATPase subunit